MVELSADDAANMTSLDIGHIASILQDGEATEQEKFVQFKQLKSVLATYCDGLLDNTTARYLCRALLDCFSNHSSLGLAGEAVFLLGQVMKASCSIWETSTRAEVIGTCIDRVIDIVESLDEDSNRLHTAHNLLQDVTSLDLEHVVAYFLSNEGYDKLKSFLRKCVDLDGEDEVVASLKTVALRVLLVVLKGGPAFLYRIQPDVDFWLKLLLPQLFSLKSWHVRSVTLDIFKTLVKCKLHYSETASWESLKDDIKDKYVPVMLALVGSQDWCDLWCITIDLIGNELQAERSTTDLVKLFNRLLSVPEKAFKSADPATRLLAFDSWKFLIEKFSSRGSDLMKRKLKLLNQPLLVRNDKTSAIYRKKIEVWWCLIHCLGKEIDSCLDTVVIPFFKFCFGIVGGQPFLTPPLTPEKSPSKKDGCPSHWKLDPANHSTLMFVLYEFLKVEPYSTKADIAENFANLAPLSVPVIDSAKKFLSLSHLLIFGVGECIFLISEDSQHECKVKLLWKALLRHVCLAVDSRGSAETQESQVVEMVRDVQRVLRGLVDQAKVAPWLAPHIVGGLLEEVLEGSQKLPAEVLVSHAFDAGSTDFMNGTPALLLIELLLSPSLLFVMEKDLLCRHRSLFKRVVQLCVGAGVTGSLQFTQAVVKRLDVAVQEKLLSEEHALKLWQAVAKQLLRFAMAGGDVNQGSDACHDFLCIYSVLLFPLHRYHVACVEQADKLVDAWSRLYTVFVSQAHQCASVDVNEVGEFISGKICSILKKATPTAQQLLIFAGAVRGVVNCVPYSIITTQMPSKKRSNSLTRTKSEKPLTNVSSVLHVVSRVASHVRSIEQWEEPCSQVATLAAHSVSSLFKLGCPGNAEAVFLQVAPVAASLLELPLGTPDLTRQLRQLWSSCADFVVANRSHFTLLKVSDCLVSLTSAALKSHNHQVKRDAFKFATEKVQDIFKLESLDIPTSLMKAIELCRNDPDLFAEDEVDEDSQSKGKPIKLAGSFLSKFTGNVGQQIDSAQDSKSSVKGGKESTPRNKTAQVTVLKGSPSTPLSLKKRPLTAHQREMMRKRRDDIPALYEDLTQDSQERELIDSQENSMCTESASACVMEHAVSHEIGITVSTKNKGGIEAAQTPVSQDKVGSDEDGNSVKKSSSDLEKVVDSKEARNKNINTFKNAISEAIAEKEKKKRRGIVKKASKGEVEKAVSSIEVKADSNTGTTKTCVTETDTQAKEDVCPKAGVAKQNNVSDDAEDTTPSSGVALGDESVPNNGLLQSCDSMTEKVKASPLCNGLNVASNFPQLKKAEAVATELRKLLSVISHHSNRALVEVPKKNVVVEKVPSEQLPDGMFTSTQCLPTELLPDGLSNSTKHTNHDLPVGKSRRRKMSRPKKNNPYRINFKNCMYVAKPPSPGRKLRSRKISGVPVKSVKGNKLSKTERDANQQFVKFVASIGTGNEIIDQRNTCNGDPDHFSLHEVPVSSETSNFETVTKNVSDNKRNGIKKKETVKNLVDNIISNKLDAHDKNEPVEKLLDDDFSALAAALASQLNVSKSNSQANSVTRNVTSFQILKDCIKKKLVTEIKKSEANNSVIGGSGLANDGVRPQEDTSSTNSPVQNLKESPSLPCEVAEKESQGANNTRRSSRISKRKFLRSKQFVFEKVQRLPGAKFLNCVQKKSTVDSPPNSMRHGDCGKSKMKSSFENNETLSKTENALSCVEFPSRNNVDNRNSPRKCVSLSENQNHTGTCVKVNSLSPKAAVVSLSVVDNSDDNPCKKTESTSELQGEESDGAHAFEAENASSEFPEGKLDHSFGRELTLGDPQKNEVLTGKGRNKEQLSARKHFELVNTKNFDDEKSFKGNRKYRKRSWSSSLATPKEISEIVTEDGPSELHCDNSVDNGEKLKHATFSGMEPQVTNLTPATGSKSSGGGRGRKCRKLPICVQLPKPNTAMLKSTSTTEIEGNHSESDSTFEKAVASKSSGRDTNESVIELGKEMELADNVVGNARVETSRCGSVKRKTKSPGDAKSRKISKMLQKKCVSSEEKSSNIAEGTPIEDGQTKEVSSGTEQTKTVERKKETRDSLRVIDINESNNETPSGMCHSKLSLEHSEYNELPKIIEGGSAEVTCGSQLEDNSNKLNSETNQCKPSTRNNKSAFVENSKFQSRKKNEITIKTNANKLEVDLFGNKNKSKSPLKAQTVIINEIMYGKKQEKSRGSEIMVDRVPLTKKFSPGLCHKSDSPEEENFSQDLVESSQDGLQDFAKCLNLRKCSVTLTGLTLLDNKIIDQDKKTVVALASNSSFKLSPTYKSAKSHFPSGVGKESPVCKKINFDEEVKMSFHVQSARCVENCNVSFKGSNNSPLKVDGASHIVTSNKFSSSPVKRSLRKNKKGKFSLRNTSYSVLKSMARDLKCGCNDQAEISNIIDGFVCDGAKDHEHSCIPDEGKVLPPSAKDHMHSCVPDEDKVSPSSVKDHMHSGIPDRSEVSPPSANDHMHSGIPDNSEVSPPSANDHMLDGIPDKYEVSPPSANDHKHSSVPDEEKVLPSIAKDHKHSGIPDKGEVSPPIAKDCMHSDISDEGKVSLPSTKDHVHCGISDEGKISPPKPVSRSIRMLNSVHSLLRASCINLPSQNNLQCENLLPGQTADTDVQVKLPIGKLNNSVSIFVTRNIVLDSAVSDDSFSAVTACKQDDVSPLKYTLSPTRSANGETSPSNRSPRQLLKLKSRTAHILNMSKTEQCSVENRLHSGDAAPLDDGRSASELQLDEGLMARSPDDKVPRLIAHSPDGKVRVKEWKRHTYSPVATPRNSSLKRMRDGRDSTSPPAKKKSVSFSDPPRSMTLVFGRLMGAVVTEEPRRNTRSKRRVTMYSGLREFASIDGLSSRLGGGGTSQTQGSEENNYLESQGSVEEKTDRLVVEPNRDPFYEPLRNCKEPVKNISNRLVPKIWAWKLAEFFETCNIKTVGDLATLPTWVMEDGCGSFLDPAHVRKMLKDYELQHMKITAMLEKLTHPAVTCSTETGVTAEPTRDYAKPTRDDAEPTRDVIKPVGDVAEPAGDVAKPAGDVAEPAGDVAEPAGDVAEPAGDDAEPAGDFAEPTGDFAEPTGEVAEPVGDVAEPTEEVAKPEEDVAEPVGDFAKPTGEVAEPEEDSAEPEGDVAEPAGDVAEPAGDVAEPAGDVAEPAGDVAEPAGDVAEPAGDVAEPAGDVVAEPVRDVTEPTAEDSEPMGGVAKPKGENSEQSRDVVEPFGETSEQTRDAADLSKEATEAIRQTVKATRDAGELTTKQVCLGGNSTNILDSDSAVSGTYGPSLSYGVSSHNYTALLDAVAPTSPDSALLDCGAAVSSDHSGAVSSDSCGPPSSYSMREISSVGGSMLSQNGHVSSVFVDDDDDDDPVSSSSGDVPSLDSDTVTVQSASGLASSVGVKLDSSHDDIMSSSADELKHLSATNQGVQLEPAAIGAASSQQGEDGSVCVAECGNSEGLERGSRQPAHDRLDMVLAMLKSIPRELMRQRAGDMLVAVAEVLSALGRGLNLS